MLALASAPASDENLKYRLQVKAKKIIQLFSLFPLDKENVQRLENYNMTETLFEVALHAHNWEAEEIVIEAERILLNWGIKAGAYSTGCAVLEKSVYGLIAISQWTKTDVISRLDLFLKQDYAPSQELRDRAARSIEREGITRFRSPYSLSVIDKSLGKMDSKIRDELISKVVALLYSNEKDTSKL